MKSARLVLAVLVLMSLTPVCALAASRVGVVVRDGADAGWQGALVMRDIFQRPTIIGLLPEGTEVDILPHLSNKTYLYVVTDGIRGWVKQDYIQELDGRSKRQVRPGVRKPVLFSDIPADHWARKAVEQMVKAGLIGKSGDRFYGNKPVTRYELAVVLDRAQKRAEQSRESIESRLRALEDGAGAPAACSAGHHHQSGCTPATGGGNYRFLLSLGQTLRNLHSQSVELRGRVDALEPAGNQDVARKVAGLEHRLDVIERTLDNG